MLVDLFVLTEHAMWYEDRCCLAMVPGIIIQQTYLRLRTHQGFDSQPNAMVVSETGAGFSTIPAAQETYDAILKIYATSFIESKNWK